MEITWADVSEDVFDSLFTEHGWYWTPCMSTDMGNYTENVEGETTGGYNMDFRMNRTFFVDSKYLEHVTR